MKRLFLTYFIIVVFGFLAGGCAASMKSNRVGIGQNRPANLPPASSKPLQPNNTGASYALQRLGDFIHSYNKTLSSSQAYQVADAILQTSSRYKVDYRIITALVAIESGFRPDARSRSGAMGLGQLMPITARGLNVKNPFDPFDNLNGAVKLLRSHLEQYNGDINFALGAYKMGSGAVKRSGISHHSTISYIKRVRKVFDTVP